MSLQPQTITVSTHELHMIVNRAVLEAISPFLTMENMMKCYDVKTSKTITSMERRGEIPTRTKSGYWLRSEVNEWDKLKKLAVSR